MNNYTQKVIQSMADDFRIVERHTYKVRLDKPGTNAAWRFGNGICLVKADAPKHIMQKRKKVGFLFWKKYEWDDLPNFPDYLPLEDMITTFWNHITNELNMLETGLLQEDIVVTNIKNWYNFNSDE